MLIYNPDERITAKQCLKHPFFKELRDLDKRNQVSAIPTITKDLGVFIAAPPNDRKNYHQNSKDPF
jgi:serine/threonine protein kinase